MDADEVARLAQLENARWVSSSEEAHRSAPRSPLKSCDVAEALLSSAEGAWKAYVPLGSTEADAVVAPEGLTNIGFCRAAALGTILVVSFSWLPDPEQREYLLHLDYAGLPSNLDAGGALLLERLVQLAARPEWYQRDTIAVSDRVSVVLPRSTPD